ncbi:MAG: phosphoenolpyruvate-utilizing N-terminal domain-containing protein, partial [Anaerolineae bacterium]
MKSKNIQEINFRGAPVSDGIAIGIPFFVELIDEFEIPEFTIALDEVDAEISRYRKALYSSRQDLERLQVHLIKEGSSEVSGIIDTHIQMLEDPMITTQIEESIRKMLQNTEAVFCSVINDYKERFTEKADSFFQQRLVDILDLSKRILS